MLWHAKDIQEARMKKPLAATMAVAALVGPVRRVRQQRRRTSSTYDRRPPLMEAGSPDAAVRTDASMTADAGA